MKGTVMVFLENEVRHWSVHEGTGQIQLSIDIELVLSKLPKDKSVKICRWESKEAVEAEYFPKLKEVRFTNWVAMHFERTKSDMRKLTAYANLLENLCHLAQTYGEGQLSAALSKCDVPGKCTLEYVKAILKNRRQANKRFPSEQEKYQEQIDQAVKRLCAPGAAT